MKNLLLITLTAMTILAAGCEEKTTHKDEKDKSPAFMFWCFRKEIVSSDYHVPDMATPEAATYLQNHLKSVPGYESSKCDLETRTVTVSYQGSTIRKINFEEAIALSGFRVNNRPANPSAKIPTGIK